MWKPKRDENVNPRQLACFIVSWILVSWANLDKYVIRISCRTFLATGVLLSRDIFRLSPAPLFIASTPCAFLYSSDATELPLVPQEQVQQLLHPRRHNNHYISALNQCAYSTDACSSFLKLKSSFKPDVPLFGMLSTQFYYHRVCELQLKQDKVHKFTGTSAHRDNCSRYRSQPSLVHIPLPFGKTQRVFKSSIQRVLRRPLFCSPPFCCQNCTICPPASDPRNGQPLYSSFQRENILPGL